MPIMFRINGQAVSSDAPPQTPLLWIIREQIKLRGTKFGCGAGLCGACMVHIDGKRAFSCQTQLSQVAGREVTTIEGLSKDSSHPVQKAWLAERVPQCGYYVGTFYFIELESNGAHGSHDDHVQTFNVTQKVKALESRGLLTANPSVSLVPVDTPKAAAKPVLGRIVLVES
jgi:hypothetical protein